MRYTCRFSPLDTWFFRESRPQGSIGNSELGSVFPPPINTLLGAIRTSIGDAWFAEHGGNWRDFANNSELQQRIGTSRSLKPLRCNGFWLIKGEQRLWPAPANLLVEESEDEDKKNFGYLELGEPVHCDLGLVHLPKLPDDKTFNYQPSKGSWLTEQGWQAVLEGKLPTPAQLISARQLFQEEPRLGIARDNQRRSVVEGLLYQTRHLRLCADVAVELELESPHEITLPEQIVRLGGEGRQAWLRIEKSPAKPVNAHPTTLGSGPFALYLWTPMSCSQDKPMGIPEGFTESQQAGLRTWQGELNNLGLRILCVVCDRPLRQGGWNMEQHQARPVTSWLPAGSVLFVEPLNSNLLALDNQRCGQNTELGYGLVRIGRLAS